MTHRKGFQRRLWGAPIALGVASAIGLLAALVGDGPYDAVSWLGLGLPVASGLWHGFLRPRRKDRAA